MVRTPASCPSSRWAIDQVESVLALSAIVIRVA
jgi:hypothetical protein